MVLDLARVNTAFNDDPDILKPVEEEPVGDPSCHYEAAPALEVHRGGMVAMPDLSGAAVAILDGVTRFGAG